MEINNEQAHIPVVLGVAVTENAAQAFVERILSEVEESFAHTDWLVVVASDTSSVRVLARTGALA